MQAEAERHRAWKAIPQTPLADRHTAQCRALPDRSALVGTLALGGCGAEIGVASGDFTVEILKIAAPSKLHLIDAWDSERYRAGLDRVRQLLAPQIANETVVINQGLSTVVLPTFPDAYFDWLYIDTDHSFRTTLAEMCIAESKLKPNGRLMGHDFCTGNVVKPVAYGVIQACNKFCVDHDWAYEYITLESHGHFSFSLRKIDHT